MAIVEEGVLTTLITYTADNKNDLIGRQYCAMAIGNLAAEPEIHEEIVHSEGIHALMCLLKTEDIESGRYAAFALSNLAANANHRAAIVDHGAAAALVALACCDDINAQRQALSALRGLCITAAYRETVVQEGILDPIVLMARTEEIDVLREVSAALNCLSSMDNNKMELCDRAISTTIAMLLSGDVETERHACCTIANLVELAELHGRLLEERGLPPLVSLALSDDLNTKGEASRAIANLASNADVQAVLLNEGVLLPMVKALGVRDINCQRFAALGIANLATTVASQIKVVQAGAIKPLITLGLDADAPLEGRRYATLALANLSATIANHAIIVEDGALRALYSLSNSPDAMSQFYVGSALANLACNVANHAIMVEQGALQPLITLAYAQDPDVHQQAAAGLRGLAVSVENRLKIIQEGALEPLNRLLSSDDVEILREVCAALNNLSLGDENKLEIAKSGAVAPLLAHSQAHDMIIAAQACACLANIAEMQENQEIVAREGGVRPTITAMRSRYVEVQREAGRLLANLCANSDAKGNTEAGGPGGVSDAIVAGGGHQLLISYLLSQDTACQRVGTLGIGNLCTQERHRLTLMKSGLLDPLCTLARSEDIELEIQRYAVLAVANLASSVDNHAGFVAEGMLPMLTSLSNAPDAEVRQYAAYALVKVAQNADVRKQVTDEGGLEPVLYLARTDEPDVQREVIPALCTLSFVPENKVDIAKHGGLPPIVAALRDSNVDTARMACCTLANLCEAIETMSAVMDHNPIPALVDVLVSEPAPCVQCEAARCLGTLAANVEYGDEILRADAHKYLLILLRSEDERCQRMAAMALCNLASNLHNQSKMIADNILEPVVGEAHLALDPKSKSDFECVRYCLLIIANLAVDRTNHEALMREALSTIVAFAKHRDVKCRQYSVFSIGNLCSNDDNLEQIVEAGCIKVLIRYAFPSTDSATNDVQFQAIAAMRGLATHQAIRLKLVREGALEPLILAASADSIEVQREVAAALCNMALAEENKVTMARSGVAGALVKLMQSRDTVREAHACACLANLAEMVEGRTQRRLIDEGCLRYVLLLANSPDAEVRREVARALALFAAKRDSQPAIQRSGAVAQLISFARGEDMLAARHGALGIGNLGVVASNHQELFDSGAIIALLPLATSSEDLETRRVIAFALNNVASNEKNHRVLERIGVLRPLIQLVRDNDRDTHMQATFAIRQLSLTPRCRFQFVDMGGLDPLLNLADTSESVEVQREAAAALRNLSLSETNKLAIARAPKGVNVLVKFALSLDVEVAHQAVGVLANLAEAMENQAPMIEAGLLQHLKFVLRSKSVDVQREAVRAIANLSAEYAHTAAIVSAGVLVALVPALSSADFLCQRYAVMGIANLATNMSNQAKILQSGALQPLVSLARRDNGDLESQRYAVFAMCNVAATRANHVQLLNAHLIELLAALLEDADSQIRNGACFAIANFASNSANHEELLAHGVLAPLVAFTASQDPAAQLRGVQALRGLSTDANMREEIIRRGVLDPLLQLTASGDVEIQIEVLATLCNLSLSGCISKHPEKFLRACDLDTLIAFLCSADTTYRLFAAVTLGNVAADDSLQSSLAPALAPLVTIGNSADLETQRCIAYALCNLAVDPSRRATVVAEGGLPPIISLACAEDAADVLAAVTTIRGLATAPEARRAIVLAGALEALAIASRTIDDHNVKREAAAAMNCLALNEDNKLDIASSTDSLGHLVALGYTQDEEVDPATLRQGCGALANLTENIDTHEHVLKAVAGATSFEMQRHGDKSSSVGAYFAELLLGVPSKKDLGIAREATRAVANLAANHATHMALRCDEALVTSAGSNQDAIVTRFSTIALLNLATNKVNHKRLIALGAAKALVAIAAGAPRIWTRLEDQIGESTEEMALVDEMGYDIEARRYACLALGNLLAEHTNHATVLEAGGLRALVDSMVVEDAETRFDAVYACNKMASLESNHAEMLAAGAMPSLVLLAADDNSHTQCQACAALRHLSRHGESRLAIVNAGGLAALAEAAKCDIETQREVAACLCNLALADKNRADIVLSGCAASAIEMCQSVDIEVARFALGAVANIAEDPVTHRALVHHLNCLNVLVYLMRSRHVSVHREAARAVSNLLSSHASHATFLAEEGLRSLFSVANGRDAEGLYNGALIFRKLAANFETHDAMIGKGGLQSLIGLVGQPEVDTRQQAAAALRDLAADHAHKVTFAQEGGLRCVISVAREDEIELKVLAVGALRHLSLNSRIKRAILKEGGLGPLYDFMLDKTEERVDDDDDQTLGEARVKAAAAQLGTTEGLDVDLMAQIAGLLANLAEDSVNQVALVKDGAFGLLVQLSRVPYAAIQVDVARAMCSISAHTDNQVGVFGPEQLRALFDLAKHEEECCARDAAIAIGNLATVAKNQLQLVDLGCLPPLVSLLADSPFESCHKFGARALCRISAHADNQPKVVDAGGMRPLVAACSSPNTQVRHFAAMALCNVCIHEASKMKVVKVDGLRPLVKMLDDSESELCRRYAAMTLSNLTNEKSNQEHIVKHSAIQPLVRMAMTAHDFPECARFAGFVLCNLASNRLNRVPLVRAGALEPLMKMASTNSSVSSSKQPLELQRAAALGLYNVSCAAANHIAMVKAEASKALAELCQTSVDVDCKRFAIMALANLAANVQTRAAATRGGGFQSALKLLRDAEVDIRRYACVCLGNMANHPTTQVQLIVHGGLSAVLAIAHDDHDVESQRQALMVLVNVAANEANHAHISAKQHQNGKTALQVLLGLAVESPDATCRDFATFGLANLASDPELLAQIGRAGGLEPLVRLAHSTNIHSQCLALSAIRRLSGEPENRARLVEAGGLRPLASAGLSAEVELQREVAACLCNVTLDPTSRFLAAETCLPTIVRLADSGDREAARQAIGALANLAEDPETHLHIAVAGGSRCMVALLAHEAIDVHREASRAVANLLTSFEHQAGIVADGVAGIVELARSADAECQYNAALSLRKLTPNLESHQPIIEHGGLEALIDLLEVRDCKEVPTRRHAASALRDLAANPAARFAFAERRGINAMVKLLTKARELSLHALATAALRHLSLEDELKRRVVEAGALAPTIRNAHEANEDLKCQIAGLLANLSEELENQIALVSSGCVPVLCALSHQRDNPEIQQDCARALANIVSNEENHVLAYRQGALQALVTLARVMPDEDNPLPADDVTQRYAAMGLRFLSSHPEVRLFIVRERIVGPFLALAKSPLVEYRRTAAAALASFTLSFQNKAALVRQGGLSILLKYLVRDTDLHVARDAVFALANLSDALDLQADLVKERAVDTLSRVAEISDDARVQRDTSRSMACLSQNDEARALWVENDNLRALFRLARSLDVACQRYAALALCNLACGAGKASLVQHGAIKPLIFLARFPDSDIQRYAALAIAALALGDHGDNKVRLVEEGALRPLLDMIKFPEVRMQQCAALALNAIALGPHAETKLGIARDDGLGPILTLVASTDSDCRFAAVYALGSLAENSIVKAQLVEAGSVEAVVHAVQESIDVELKRASAYLLACFAENVEFHLKLLENAGLECVVALASLEDVECQEMAAFALAHLASDRDLQVPLVDKGALRPLVVMMAVHAAPRHYAGLALLKLADNFNNHCAIAQEGGIQALLRLGRERSTEPELQYKAALTVGSLASNAVRMMPPPRHRGAPEIGIGAAAMLKARISHESRRASEATLGYLDKALATKAPKPSTLPPTKSPVSVPKRPGSLLWPHSASAPEAAGPKVVEGRAPRTQ